MDQNKTLPRLIRFKEAPAYLGMNRNRFNEEVRPYIAEIRMGIQGVAFDRLDLDAWVEQYKHCNGRPALRRSVWDEEECQDSPKEARSGTSTKKSTELEFAKALERVGLKKQKNT